MAKKRRSHSSSKGGMGGVLGKAAGVGGYILFEALVEPKLASAIGDNGLLLNVLELAAGVYAARKGGIVGEVGKAAIYINAYQILRPFAANLSL